MSDEMIDLAAGDVRLRQRLAAYADVRLTPDVAATSRMRARVLAHAHRRGDLVRADAALRIVSDTASRVAKDRSRRQTRRAAVALAAAAILAGAMVGGAAASSGPGGALYEARLWIEDVSLPSDPSARAVAELSRLADRLREADTAASRGDQRAAAAALVAYERIVAAASAAVLDAHDPVAAAALETGIGRNVEVLQALIGRAPAQATEAISRAVEGAIARSNRAIDTVDDIGQPPRGGGSAGGDGAGGDGAAGNGHDVGGGGHVGNGGGPEATPKPTKTPVDQPEATPKPTRTPVDQPGATPKPTKTPKPDGPAPGGPPGDRQD